MPRSILALFLCIWLPMAAQQPPASNAANGPMKDLVISTTTELVVEDVMIKGKNGQAIVGLQPSDFTITEDGKPQKISVFEFQTLEEGAPGAPPPSVKPPADVAAAKPP